MTMATLEVAHHLTSHFDCAIRAMHARAWLLDHGLTDDQIHEALENGDGTYRPLFNLMAEINPGVATRLFYT